MLYEWVSKEKKELDFNIEKEEEDSGRFKFEVTIFVDEQLVGNGKGMSKKQAEKHACEAACQLLNIK